MKHYFTFGVGQLHENGFHVIESESPDKARLEMIGRFGMKWSMQYNEKEWFEGGTSQEEKYGLHQVR